MRPELELLTVALTLVAAGVLGAACERASALGGRWPRVMYFASLGVLLFAAQPDRRDVFPPGAFTPLAVACVAGGVLASRILARRAMLAVSEQRARALRAQVEG